MGLPLMCRSQTGPPSEHDVVFIQHIGHKLPDARLQRFHPQHRQQDRAHSLALKFIRHCKGDFRTICGSLQAPVGATAYARDLVIVFDHDHPRPVLAVVIGTQPLDEFRIGPLHPRPKPEVRGFRREPPEGIRDPLPVVRRQRAQDHRELITQQQAVAGKQGGHGDGTQ